METIIQHLIKAFTYVIDSVDMVYLVMFMLTCYIILKGFEEPLRLFKYRYEKKWFTRTRTIVLVVGLLYAVLFGICKLKWGLPYSTPDMMPYGYVLFFSFIVGQFLNLYGIETLIDAIIKGFKGVWQKGLDKFGRS